MSCKNCPNMSKTFQNHVSGGWMGVHIFEAKTINNPKIPFTQFTPVKLVDTRAAILSEIAPSRTESFLLHYACVFGQLLQKNTSIGRVMRCRTVPSLLFCRPVQEWNCPWSYLPHLDFARAIRAPGACTVVNRSQAPWAKCQQFQPTDPCGTQNFSYLQTWTAPMVGSLCSRRVTGITHPSARRRRGRVGRLYLHEDSGPSPPAQWKGQSGVAKRPIQASPLGAGDIIATYFDHLRSFGCSKITRDRTSINPWLLSSVTEPVAPFGSFKRRLDLASYEMPTRSITVSLLFWWRDFS